jgi:hypothetical protein
MFYRLNYSAGAVMSVSSRTLGSRCSTVVDGQLEILARSQPPPGKTFERLELLIRHDDRAGGGEHAAHTVADGDLGIGDLGGAMPRIWRTLSCNAYMPYMPECM